MELTVYKASAGSGKTFTLAVEYIKRLALDPTAYRRILAVTFTNKATTEMKERILQQLLGISKGYADSEAYLAAVRTQLDKSGAAIDDDEIRRRCGEALTAILHDYSRFRVSTIDSFFQTVTRNVARELGIGSEMNIDLDAQRAVSDAVDRMIANLDSTSPTLQWIIEFIDSQLDDDKSRHVERSLKSFGTKIFDETYMEHGEKLRNQLQTEGFIAAYRSTLNAAHQKALSSLSQYYDELHRALAANGIDISELALKGRNIETYFLKLKTGNGLDKRGTTIDGLMADPEKWVNKTSKRHDEIVQLAQDRLMPLATRAEEARQQAMHTLNSVSLSLRYLYQLQLLNAIADEVGEQNRLKNRFLLPETNRLLAGLIGEDDSSFIYEKIGASITNIMIDEFQDTSHMQWGNLRPLLREGLAEGADSLIVGDVKQSIYRWRGGDWNILNNMRPTEKPFSTVIRTLDTNRRSEARIVSFNNSVFTRAVSSINAAEQADDRQPIATLTAAYADVMQRSGKQQGRGFVKVQFVDPDDYKPNMLKALGDEVEALLASGIPMNGIALLLRQKSVNLPLIADYFESQLGLPVVSDEAFRLDASTSVNMIVNALRILANPDDSIALASLAADHQAMTNPGCGYASMFSRQAIAALPEAFTAHTGELKLLPLYELAERLYEVLGLKANMGQDAYMFKFFDEVSKFLRDNASDISSFLDYWDQEMHAATIPSGEIDGIRILTIHKAKGLQFHTVIVPFCDWSLTTQKEGRNIIWCHTDEQPYSAIDMVPLAYSSKLMADSAYSDDYKRERTQLMVDSLNLLYVAFTRPEKNLIVMARSAEPKDEDGEKKRRADAKMSTVSDLLHSVLEATAADTGGTWDDAAQTFTLGNLVTETKSGKAAESQNILSVEPSQVMVEMQSRVPQVEFRESNRSADFIAGADSLSSPYRFIDRGNLMHRLFASIRTATDADRAVSSLVSEGVLSDAAETESIRQETRRALNDPRVSGWFDGSWTLFNECNIIWTAADGSLTQERPDRVMMRGDKVVVVDYKFGKPKRSHATQVRGYMDLLHKMGYGGRSITGYLWYVDRMEIEEVK